MKTRNIDCILMQKPLDTAFTRDEIIRMIDSELMIYGAEEVDPIRFEGNNAWAFGFIREEAADRINYEYKPDSAFGKEVLSIIDDVSKENSSQYYCINGIRTKITY